MKWGSNLENIFVKDDYAMYECSSYIYLNKAVMRIPFYLHHHLQLLLQLLSRCPAVQTFCVRIEYIDNVLNSTFDEGCTW